MALMIGIAATIVLLSGAVVASLIALYCEEKESQEGED